MSALCCFTPFLTIALPAVGLGGFMGYIYNDAMLLLALAIFLAIAGYGFWRSRTA
ncbi:MAG: mercury resistance system transport protein MerF [Rhizobiaceae bacterium]